MASLFLSILLPVIILLGTMGAILGFHILIKRKESISKGTILFELDIYNRRIKLYNRLSNNTVNKSIFNHESSETWVSLSELTKNFKDTPGERKFRNGFVQALKNDNVNFNFLTDKIVRSKKLVFKVRIDKISEIDSHILNLSWDQTKSKETAKFKRKNLTKLELAENSATYKGFLAFALDYQITNVENVFVQHIMTILRPHNLEMLFSNGLVCIPFFGDKMKKVKKKMNRYIKLIENKGFKLGLNRIAFGSSQISGQDINTPQRVNVVLKTLGYLTNLSMRKNINFIDRENKHFKEKEYENFSEASQVFRLALRSGDIKSKPIIVRKYKTKRKVIEYIIPTIEQIQPGVLHNILKNPYNRSKLVDAHAKKISVEKKKGKPALFDVNANWIVENRSKIALKKSVYVVNFPDTVTHDQVESITTLKEKGFIFAIRVKGYNEQVATLIMNIKPQFVVIDEALASVASPTTYIQLVSIKKIASLGGAKIIFENPSNNIDKEWSDKINLDFYYEF